MGWRRRRGAGVKRWIHMSAMGAREGAASRYHETKWRAEQAVMKSGLDWTIIRPSLIHGEDGEFVEMVRGFLKKGGMPIVPYFGRACWDWRVGRCSLCGWRMWRSCL